VKSFVTNNNGKFKKFIVLIKCIKLNLTPKSYKIVALRLVFSKTKKNMILCRIFFLILVSKLIFFTSSTKQNRIECTKNITNKYYLTCSEINKKIEKIENKINTKYFCKKNKVCKGSRYLTIMRGFEKDNDYDCSCKKSISYQCSRGYCSLNRKTCEQFNKIKSVNDLEKIKKC
jgi:hypothetical protein